MLIKSFAWLIKKRGICFFAVLFVCFIANMVVAQEKSGLSWNFPGDFSLFLKMEERLRWEYRDDIHFMPEDATSGDFLGNRFRINMRFSAGKNFTIVLEGQDTRIWNSDLNAVKLTDHFDDLRLAFLEAKNLGGVEGLSMRLGRQEIIYGDERLIGAFGWSNVGRSFNAIKLRYEKKTFFVDAFFAGARQRPLIPDKKTQTLSGIYSGWLKDRAFNFETYFLIKNDSDFYSGEIDMKKDHTKITTFGVRVIGNPADNLSAVVELAIQNGHKGGDSHKAHAESIKIDYSFPSSLSPVIGFIYSHGSGDKNPLDGKSSNFDNLYPTNHNKYGLMDYHNLSNIYEIGIFVSMKPVKYCSLAIEGHNFRLDSSRAPWTNSGGAVMGWDPTGNSGHDTGKEIDLSCYGNVLKRIKWLAGYSYYLPGEFAKKTHGELNNRFAYIQLTLSL